MIIKKINKKLAAAILLALILCISAFLSACGPKSSEPTQDPNSQATQAPEANVTPEPQNFGAFTVVIPDNGKYNIATENDLVKQAIINDIVKEKSILIDINVIAVDSTNYLEQINSVLSSGQSVEAIVDDYSTFDTYINIPGICLPIDELLTAYGQNMLNTISSDSWNAVTRDGKVCAVPSAAIREKTAMYVRQDMLNMMMGTEFSIVTREEFDAALIAFSTLKPSGITPLAVNYDQAIDYMSYLRHSPTSDFVYEYGEYIMREQHRYFPDFLNMLRDYYAKGYLPEDFFEITQEQITTLFTSGLAMMYITEYNDVDADYCKLLSEDSNAEVQLVTKPTHRRMAQVELSAEAPVSEICMFTSYGQNHSALMIYLDWLVSDVENYETANLGVMGTQLNFNNIAHEYQLLGNYEQMTDYYNSIFGLGLSNDALYWPVIPINGNEVQKKCKQLEFDSYQHLTTASMVDEGTYNLSAEGQNALANYRFNMNEAVRRYVIGEISYAEYMQYYENNEAIADIIIAELNTMEPNGTRK